VPNVTIITAADPNGPQSVVRSELFCSVRIGDQEAVMSIPMTTLASDVRAAEGLLKAACHSRPHRSMTAARPVKSAQFRQSYFRSERYVSIVIIKRCRFDGSKYACRPCLIHLSVGDGYQRSESGP